MRDTDTYRSMSVPDMLIIAREEGVDADMAVAMAERLELQWERRSAHPVSMGGRYKFIHRSEA